MVKEKRPDWKPNVEWWMRIAIEQMNSGNYTQLFVVKGNKYIGFGDFFLFPEPSTGKIHCTGQHIFIRKKYRKSIAAFLLLRRWFRMAKESNCDVVDLFSFSNETERWARLGFRPTRVLMRKEI